MGNKYDQSLTKLLQVPKYQIKILAELCSPWGDTREEFA